MVYKQLVMLSLFYRGFELCNYQNNLFNRKSPCFDTRYSKELV